MAELSDQSDLERNLPATPWKLQKARERGVVGKSAELVSVVVFVCAVGWLAIAGWEALLRQFQFDKRVFERAAAVPISVESACALMGAMVSSAASVLTPFFALLMVAAVVANLIQTGFVFSGKPLVPDWKRLDPLAGFKRFFSTHLVVEGLKVSAKIVVMCAAFVALMKGLAPEMMRLSRLPAGSFLRFLVDTVVEIGFLLALVMAAFALIDVAWTRRQFAKRMRMSPREMRDEMKDREGDPRIRSRLRELRRELAKRSRTLSATRGADVLITNPTHLAVALSYRHGEMDAPRVLAKGAGKLAAAMRELAGKRGIPVVQNRSLARALWRRSAVDAFVPAAFYAELAKVIVWVMAARKGASR